MSDSIRIRRSRPLGRSLFLAVAAGGALAACNEQRIQTGFEGDIVAPIVSIGKTAGDSMDVAQHLKFSVSGADNLGLKTISITLTGGFTGQIDTTFRSAVTSVTLPIDIAFPANTIAGGRVFIRATATDGNNNSAVAQDSILLTNRDALIVSLIRPLTGAITSAGKQVLIQVNAHQNKGITKIGWIAAGAVTGSDSILYGPPLDTTSIGPTFTDTLDVPASVTAGTFTITGFAEDASSRRVLSLATPVSIQSVATDNQPPIVTFTVPRRAEVRDSVFVRATDPSGIILIGWTATNRATGVLVGGDSATSSGTLTDVSQSFNLNFGGAAFANFPVDVLIEAFAVDFANNRGSALLGTAANAPLRRDTVTVVNGITRPLPNGGRVADAIYNRNLNEIYMTNPALDRVEVFSVTDTTFVAFIAVGSKPWGIALWPRDTLGNNADTVVVANSGGTSLSIVDLQIRRERRRHALPNFLVEGVHAVFDRAGNLTGFEMDDHDFSDRPQYLGMVCRPAGGTACAADSIYGVYSTTPTAGQGANQVFAGRGTVRWENLTSPVPESHFFWEHARPSALADSLFAYSDTIQIVVDGGGRPNPVVLIGASCFLSVELEQLAFEDTTFIRNSGNFTHAFVGEGGAPSSFARVLRFDAALGVTTRNCPQFPAVGPILIPASILLRENGVSPGRHVSDFISNTSIGVRSIATNFNGQTNLVRADSIYVLNDQLRLTGIIQAPGSNWGMDLNFDHRFNADVGGTPGTFTGTLNPNDRLAFTARPDANVDVFDTFFYGLIASIPLRDPVTGPIRVARLPSGEQILVGVTARGVVTARLPAVVNPYLIPSLWGAPQAF